MRQSVKRQQQQHQQQHQQQIWESAGKNKKVASQKQSGAYTQQKKFAHLAETAMSV